MPKVGFKTVEPFPGRTVQVPIKQEAPQPKLATGTPKDKTLAVNLFDLGRLDPEFRSWVLAGKVNASEAVWIDKKRVDETAVAFTCDLLTAALCCDLIRAEDAKEGDYPTRVYLFRKAWTKLPSNLPLTVVLPSSKTILNPKVFPTEVEYAENVPLEPKRVKLF